MFVLGALLPLQAFAAESWSQFRGGAAAGVVEAELPVSWSADENVVWKTKLPGMGWSQPVVAGDKIFLTTAVSEELTRPDPANMGPGFGERGLAGVFADFRPPNITVRFQVLCLDAATGDVVWEKTAREGRPAAHIHPNNSYATETPVTDGQHVVASFGVNGVSCYDLAGKLLWEKDLGAFPMQFGWGAASSPALYEGLVYLQCDNDQKSFLVAYDVESGDERWRVDRDENSNWSTPLVWQNKQRTELVTAGGRRMRSYDPATGELLWELAGAGRTATTPAAGEDMLFVDSYNRLTGVNGVVAAVRPGGSGDITPPAGETSSEFVAWTVPLAGARSAALLAYEGCVYVLDQGGGVARCLDAATGKQHYRNRVPGATGFVASPWASGGRVYLLDSNGRTATIEPGPQLNVIATSDLEEMCWSSPGVAGNRLLIRTVDALYCIGEQ